MKRPPASLLLALAACAPAATPGERGRAAHVRQDVEAVVAAPEFECLVTTFDENRPFGKIGTEAVLNDCNGPTPPRGASGLRGYRESRCGKDAIDNDQVWKLFRSRPVRVDAGLVDPNEKNYELAGEAIHAHMNGLGFCDEGRGQYSHVLASYVYGFAGCLVAARKEDGGTKPLSDFRYLCDRALGPAFAR